MDDSTLTPTVKGAIDALSIARKLVPGCEARAVARTTWRANTRFAKNAITSTGDASDTSVALEIAIGQRHATATTNQMDDASLRALVERAAQMAKLSPPDPEHMPVLGKQAYGAAASAYDAAVAHMGADQRAAAIAAAIAGAKRASLEGAGFVQSTSSDRVVATTAGLFAQHRETVAQMTMTARTKDGSGSGWGGLESHRAADVDAGHVARVAIDKGVKSQSPRALEPGKYTVILEPAAVAELLGFYAQALDARRADEGRSFFAKQGGGTKIGEKLFPETISLVSDPTSAETPGATSDDEGHPLAPTKWIDRGVASALRYSRFWAKKQGKESTGGHRTYHLLGGTAGRTEDLFSGVERGLLVTRFWYTRWLDPKTMTITGLTRDGVFLIEKGAVVGPVKNFRFNQSPVMMLANCDAMTQTTVRSPGGFGLWRVPALRTHEFNMASASDAI